MPREPSPADRLLTSARWPFGVAFTAFSYLWRTTPMHRREVAGAWPEDAPPDVDAAVDLSEVQRAEDGVGPFMRRRYRARIREPRARAAALMDEVQRDLNLVSPGALVQFTKTVGEPDVLRVGDEFSIRMPGPWNGPVRVVEQTPTSHRFVTLRGHIEAGQIEWRARDDGEAVVFEVESWSRAGDRLSFLLHHRLRMAKEVQLHMWTSVLERVVRRYGAGRDGPLDVDTRRSDGPQG